MNTNNLKKVAPHARTAFIKAITARAAEFGLTAKGISAPVLSGDVLQVAGYTHPARVSAPLKRLTQRIESEGLAAVIEQMAYTWFNRFCAIRFMELKSDDGYLEHGVRLLSHPSQPQGFEVLDRATEVMDSFISEGVTLDKAALLELMLAGNQQEALFRELLLGQCHRLHGAMPFLFEAIDDETELLLPQGLTRTDAFWRELVDGIPEEDWNQVEVIGWLYQFYISEKKDEVIGKVVKSADIPAATQLFTPNWIVQYLVQNSLGRYWLQTYPGSPLQQAMPYFVSPGEQPAEVLAELARLTPTSIEPESITVLDPACGSGHILVEAYNLLYRIYEERGYRSRDIPQLILSHNLYGLDIDDRAAQLAGFALIMRARQDDRRLFSRTIALNIHALQATEQLNIAKLWQALNLNADWDRGQVQDLFATAPHTLAANDARLSLLLDLQQRFLDAKTLGSLIEVPAGQAQAIAELVATLHSLSISGDAMQKPAARALLPLLKQASVLAKRYDAVIANPPYMGSKFYTDNLKSFINSDYKCSKPDLYSAFIEKAYNICINNGRVGMITIPNWMFLSSFEDIRKLVVSETFIENFVHNGRGVWGSDFGSCSFVFKKTKIPKAKGNYKRLFHKPGSVASNNELIERFFNFPEYHAMSEDFKSIPGSPIAYWASDKVFDAFKNNPKLKKYLSPKQGTSTGNDDVYVRFWFEVGVKKIGLGLKSLDDALNSDFSYFPLDKGGDFRRWYGNNEKVIRFGDGGYEDLLDMGNHLPSRDMYFKKGLTWSKITSFKISVRYDDYGFVFSSVGLKGFPDDSNMYVCLGYMNSSLVDKFTEITSPTVSIISGDIEKLPYIESLISKRELESGVISLVDISKHDWDSKELSWGFKNQELLSLEHHQLTLDATYQRLRAHWLKMVTQMQHLEHENNRLFIDAYGLQDELTPEVPLSEITLTCNPHYRYGGNLTDEEREARLQSDTMCELISYAIGCMMGRYSLDREGLVYAHAANEGFKALVEEGAYATFAADDDGILPLTQENWFEDDVAARIEQFVASVWGNEQLEENLNFIADSLCLHAIKPLKKGGETARETIRRYLSTQFYKDHLKTYKKRPIYWLFSSGKEKAFECLVYLHRYNESTLPRMRTEYVTPLLGQIASRIERKRLEQTEASTAEAKRIAKDIDSLNKQLSELRAFDDALKHHADMRISLDLDDGVKVNYCKFGNLLSDVKAITGGKDE